MKRSARLVFFGTEDFSAPTLRKLMASNWNVVAIVTKPDAAAGRGQKIKAPTIKHMADTVGIRIFQPQAVLEIKKELQSLNPTHGVLAAYGKILPPEIIDVFPGGIINIHPSLLPKYRGPSPIEAAILNGDRKTGISLMKLTAGMDEGPVYAQMGADLPTDANAVELASHLAEAGADLLIEELPEIIDGSLTPKPQNDAHATYTELLKKEDGVLGWHKPALQLERQVRAYLRWPKSRANIFGQEVIVTKARSVPNETDGALVIPCRPGWLEIQELIAPSGRTMSGADFIRGYSSPR